MNGFVLQSIEVTADPGFVLESIEAATAPTIAVLHDLDAGNINPALTVISDAETATPSISLTPRITPSSLGSGHVHWLFALSGAAGKQPIITVSNARRCNQMTMGESWRPVYSYDLETWHQGTAFTPLTSPIRVQFQFPTAFESDTVYIADHPVFQAAHFDALAAEMAADPTGLVHLSSIATSGGVIGTTPTENDDIGRAVGGNAMYGFRLEDESTTTTDGKPRRELVVTCGIHAGEVIDGWFLRSLVDYYINDISATAVAFRRNWRVLTYFALTPNGRKGGNWRGNWRYTEDPNRDWDAPGAFSLFETTTVRDAILADASRRDVLLDFHSDSASFVVPRIYYRSDLPFERYTAFKNAFDARDTSALTVNLSIAARTIGEWSAANGAKLVITSEPGTRISTTVERYGQIATNYVGALVDMDAAGWFDSPVGILTLGTPSVIASSISLPWTYSASDHTGVEYRYRLTAGTWSAWTDVGRVSPIEITGLNFGAEYEVEARSYNVLGTGTPQTVTVTMEVDVFGVLSATESGADTFAASGAVIVTDQITGTLFATESGADTFAASGVLIVAGTLAVTESGVDTFAASGDVIVNNQITGMLFAQEEVADTAEITGAVFITGSLSVTESGADTVSATGNFLITGSLSATEQGADTALIVGANNQTGYLIAQESGRDSLISYGEISQLPGSNTSTSVNNQVQINSIKSLVNYSTNASLIYLNNSTDLIASSRPRKKPY